MSERTRDDDDSEAGIVGLCAWCGETVLESDEYEEGNHGEGVMHKNCKVCRDQEDEEESR